MVSKVMAVDPSLILDNKFMTCYEPDALSEATCQERSDP
jgi:hypothetical protein